MTSHPPITVTDHHVLHLDENSVAVDKEAGWPVHATRDPNRPHLQGAVEAWLNRRAGDNKPVEAPAVVHRLDVWTSGVVLLARTVEARPELGGLFARREVTKVYEAVCVGGPEHDEGELRHHLAKRREHRRNVMHPVRSGGKSAITRFTVLARGDGLSLVRLEPQTGRTHQLRVQTAVSGWPILGDRLYGDPVANQRLEGQRLEGQLLHARHLGYVDPFTGDRRDIEAPPPSRFAAMADRVRAGAD